MLRHRTPSWRRVRAEPDAGASSLQPVAEVVEDLHTFGETVDGLLPFALSALEITQPVEGPGAIARDVTVAERLQRALKTPHALIEVTRIAIGVTQHAQRDGDAEFVADVFGDVGGHAQLLFRGDVVTLGSVNRPDLATDLGFALTTAVSDGRVQTYPVNAHPGRPVGGPVRHRRQCLRQSPGGMPEFSLAGQVDG